jgi:hypothetical protein
MKWVAVIIATHFLLRLIRAKVDDLYSALPFEATLTNLECLSLLM